MAHLRRTSRAAGPVVARVVGIIRVSAAVPLRSRKNCVLNRWRIADAVNDLSMLVRGLSAGDTVAVPVNPIVAVRADRLICYDCGSSDSPHGLAR